MMPGELEGDGVRPSWANLPGRSVGQTMTCNHCSQSQCLVVGHRRKGNLKGQMQLMSYTWDVFLTIVGSF